MEQYKTIDTVCTPRELTLVTPEQDRPYWRNVTRAVEDFCKYQANPAAFAREYISEIRDNFSSLAKVTHKPTVEVIIPTKNDIPSFGLLQLSKQVAVANLRVTILANGTDKQGVTPYIEMFCDVPNVRVVSTPEALGVNGGKAYGVMKVADSASDYVVTVDADSGPVSPWWLHAGLSGFTSSDVGAVYGPIVFPEPRLVAHKAVTLPAQFILAHTQGYINTVGPNTFFRREAIARPMAVWELDQEVDAHNGDIRAVYDQYPEDSLLKIVQEGGYTGKNIFNPESVVLTSGRRIPKDYLLIGASKFMPIQKLRDWGKKRFEDMYTISY